MVPVDGLFRRQLTDLCSVVGAQRPQSQLKLSGWRWNKLRRGYQMTSPSLPDPSMELTDTPH